jgi:molybdopterin/thiamine biosynthesis adenylyltransferase
MRQQRSESNPTGKSVVVIGAGGNIGSHLMPHLARMPGLSQITCVDRDLYDEKNLTSQDITPRDVGKPKAAVQARRLRRINPALTVHYIKETVERVPLGQLRGDLMLSCLDSKRARSYAQQFAWRLGMPFIDAGVLADGLLARVNVYLPGKETACMECSWTQADYDAIEQTYPCQYSKSDSSSPFSTNAPSSLGALAASLQALEVGKFLCGQLEYAAVGREVVLNALNHKHYVTEIRRRSDCRFDHEVWKIEKLTRHPKAITLGEALALGRAHGESVESFTLGVEGTAFVTRLSCVNCNESRKLLWLQNRLSQSARTCSCGREMMVPAFERLEHLDREKLPAKALDRSLASIGFRRGDIVTLASATGRKHYELEN